MSAGNIRELIDAAGGGTITDALGSLSEAYDQMAMGGRRYVFIVVLPALLIAAGCAIATVLIDQPLFVKAPIVLLGLLAVTVAVIYPKLILEQQKMAMDRRFHLLVTHMTVLSTTNIDRVEVFRILSREDEYTVLADEMGRIVQLVDTWNQSLDDACRMRAKQVPSKPVSNFLDRLAYTLSAGQELKDFLVKEQDIIINQYETIYEGALDNIDVMKDLYLSMLLSMTFALVFAVVLPILTGDDPLTTVGVVVVLFVFVQIGFFYTIRSISPYDPVWYHPQMIDTDIESAVLRSTAVGGVLAVILTIIVGIDVAGVNPIPLATILPVSEVPTPLYAALPVTALLIPGIVVRAQEKKVLERDEEFPSLIRALGAAETARQSTTSEVLKTLRYKDFGTLTGDVHNLYKRLNLRISPTRAWELFTAESRSYLVQKFSQMYLMGREMGGSPKQLGELISANMNTVLQLREKRRQQTVTIIGILYGVTAASIFACFIGLEIVNVMADMAAEINANSDQFDFGEILYGQVYDIPSIQFLLVAVILFNAMLSAIMIRTVDGGHKTNTYLHFVLLTWIGGLIGIGTRTLVQQILTI
jgi:archaeal flagellar protein FlaJ